MKSRTIFAACLLALLTSVHQCDRTSGAGALKVPDYNPLVKAFTSGLISAESGIRIQFAEDFRDSMKANTPVKEKAITFSPPLEGTLVYLDRRTIEFRPAEKLPRGTTFQAKLRLDKLFPGISGKEIFEFEFHTIAQHLDIRMDEFRPYNDYSPKLNYITGSVVTADAAEFGALENLLYATQQGEKLPLVWDHDPGGKMHRFTIDSVSRSDNDSEVLVHYDGSVIGATQKGVETFTIPSLGSFRLISDRVVQYPEQHVVLSFSDPIRREQNLQGLIHLETDTDVRFSVSGNNILVYPAVRQNGTVKLFIEQGIRNSAGKGLTTRETISVQFQALYPAVELMGEGVIIPQSDEVLLPFKAVNLKAVDVRVIQIFEDNMAQFLQVNQLSGSQELKRAGRLILNKQVELRSDRSINYGAWNTFSLNLTELVKTEPGALYRIEIGFRQQHSMFPCEGTELTETVLQETDIFEEAGQDEPSYWDSYESYYSYYDYYEYNGYEWEDREDPCKPAYYGNRRSVSRNILCSNLGIIAKKGSDRELLVTVTDLLQAGPLQNVSVSIYNFQQQLMQEGTTDSQGTVRFACDGQPFLIVAESGAHKGYLKLNDGSALSLSMFDVSGSVVKNGLKGFIYGERGVWRPGDSLYINLILNDDENPLPESHPVLFELKDPRGRQVASRMVRGDGSGFFSFHTVTEPGAPTGHYTVIAGVGGTQFTKLIRVESIKPNRLKIDLSFRGDTIYPDLGPVRGTLFSKWLTGATARNLRAEVEVLLKPASTSFAGYKDFIFEDPSRQLVSYPAQFFSGELDGSGNAAFAQSLDITGEAPGMLQALFTTRVFEQSGDFSIDQKSVICSPYKIYLGIRPPSGDERGVLLTDTMHRVRVVSLDPSGRPVSRVGLQVSVYKLDWRWWWQSSYEDLPSYMGNNYLNPVYSTTISTKNGEGSFSFRIEYPEWGRYLVRVQNGTSGHAAAAVVYVDWPGWAGRSDRKDPETASILTFSSDKASYKVGEEAVVTIPSSMQGRLLISMENGSRVIRQEWVQTTGDEVRYRFNVTREMTPNIYLYATLIQPHAGTENDLPIRLFGVIPIRVEDPGTKLQPVIEMEDELAPNSVVKITISEASRKKMTYTLAIVDDGLLDLTRFKTPDPWQSFYAREALGVKTWDMFEYVMGAYGGRIDGVYNIGGDEEEQGVGASEARRFPPMVRFLGPFTLEGKSRTHRVTIPNYIGSVRTMVVAGYAGSYGMAEKTVPVRQPLMVLATLPRVLGPGETVSLPVNVFVMDDKIRKVNVKLETNELLIAEENLKDVTFQGAGDRIVDFTLKTPERTGVARVKVTVTSGREVASHEIELNVRSSNPPVTRYQTAVLDPGISMDESLQYVGMPGTNDLTLEVSNIPPVDFGRRLKYLIGFPHGCIEQVTSAVFPQLYLAEVVDVGEDVRQKTTSNVEAGIRRMSAFQLPDGSFSYWPGGGTPSPWGTSYAGHFMIEAGNKGYAVPPSLLNQWKKYQRKTARGWSSSGRKTDFELRQEQLLQAYRLFTLGLAGEPELGAMNRLRERSDLTGESRWRLAAAYSLAGQHETAKELVRSASTETADYSHPGATFGSGTRDMAMILETMVLMGMRDEALPVMEMIASRLSGERWMSTQTTAYALVAIAKFTGGVKSGKTLKFSYAFDRSETVQAETGLHIARIDLDPGGAAGGNLKVTNRSDGMMYVRIIQRGTPVPGSEAPISQHLSVQADYTDMEGNRIEIEDLYQGTDFLAVYSISNPGTAGHLENLALTTIFPSGWEIHQERMFQTLGESEPFEYRDYRDDRVMTYFSLPPGRSVSYTVRLNAAYMGRFYLPSVQAEELYRNDIQVLIPGRWIEIERME
ncbi:MAG TPA: hypothetical protein ENO20_02300 [Bacteroides sp.]|nr:hypothetical protein [Bacteroides sp.]